MPIVTFLFARGDPELRRAFLEHPRWSKATYQLDRCEGLALGSEGLLAVNLDDESFVELWDGPTPSATERTFVSSEVLTVEPLCQRFDWARSVFPSLAELEALVALSKRTGRALAWFFWHERGDDLYNDAAWVFDPATEHPLAPGVNFVSASAGEFAWARQTWLMGQKDSQEYVVESGAAKAQRWYGSPFKMAMMHLGLLATTEYFVPADRSDFDWAWHRIKPE